MGSVLQVVPRGVHERKGGSSREVSDMALSVSIAGAPRTAKNKRKRYASGEGHQAGRKEAHCAQLPIHTHCVWVAVAH